ncbi:MAG: DUF302 domain-containing protein [Bacteroidota bacterium]|nr:DUF302 domain-containing protein [Bacteroidota bacterium]
MEYYYDIKVEDTFESTKEKVTEALSKEGFGILTEIDVKEVFSKKLGVDFRNYIILGPCNPSFSFKAIQAEDKIGTLLPCNVIIQDSGPAYTEVSAVDPTESMKMVSNPEVTRIAETIKQKLINALNSVKE